MTGMPPKRPVFRNIHVTQIVGYRLPIAGIVSILHRISGALLFLVGMPVMLWLLQESLVSELGFDRFLDAIEHPLTKIILLGMLWAFLHHFAAGIRYLLLDRHIGLTKEASAFSAKAVLGVSLTMTVIIAGRLFSFY